MTVDLGAAIPIETGEAFDAWLASNGERAREVVVAVHNKASGRQTVGLVELQDVGLCHGWVDTQPRRIDAERYAIRFVPRRRDSHWSSKNREMARRLLDAGRLTEAGRATLPADL